MPSWIASRSSASQETSRILWNPEVNYSIYNSLYLYLSWARSIQSILPYHFSKIRFNIILPFTPRYSMWFPSLRFPQQNPLFSNINWYNVCISYVFLKNTSFIRTTKYTFYLPQGIASLFVICLFVGFQSLYATLVCVACSQLEKLTATLIGIRQTHTTTQRDPEHRAGEQTRDRRTHSSVELFRDMQQQLNNCIRHHQQIKRWGYEKQSLEPK